MISEKMIDDYILKLKVFGDIESAVSELNRYKDLGKYNYEILMVPDKDEQYVVCESKGWELLSRRGYLFANYDD